MAQFRVPPCLRPIEKRFREHGFSCYLVGGAVRSLALKKKPVDFDLATDATPEQVMRIFRRVAPTGIKHGTVTILAGEHTFETTTFRTDGEYRDGRHPEDVEFTRSLEHDLRRRDFTINGMALDIRTGRLIDPHHGLDDLRDKTIRCIGEPDDRLSEDGLRLMRAVRFAAQLGFSIDEKTSAAVTRHAHRIAAVSVERIRDELQKTLLAENVYIGLRLFPDLGMLPYVLPELVPTTAALPGVDQNVYDHLSLTCQGAPPEPVLRFAALFHDAGKPATYKIDPESDRVTFHGHDIVSAEITEATLRRLKLPNATISQTAHLVRNHMFQYGPDTPDTALRKLVSRVGIATIPDLIALRRADIFGKTGVYRTSPYLDELETRLDRLCEQQTAFNVRDLAVTGNDLHEHAGIPKGPAMGQVLDFLLETVLDDPSNNTRSDLLTIAERYYRTRINPSDASNRST